MSVKRSLTAHLKERLRRRRSTRMTGPGHQSTTTLLGTRLKEYRIILFNQTEKILNIFVEQYENGKWKK